MIPSQCKALGPAHLARISDEAAFKCSICMAPISPILPGALVFSPPMGASMVRKVHLCSNCWDWLNEHIEGRSLLYCQKEESRLGAEAEANERFEAQEFRQKYAEALAVKPKEEPPQPVGIKSDWPDELAAAAIKQWLELPASTRATIMKNHPKWAETRGSSESK